MIRLVITNVRPSRPHRFVFVIREEHDQAFDLTRKLLLWTDENCVVVRSRGMTDGAACTVLLAKEVIDNDMPLMIVNSDQWVDCDIDDFINSLDGADGSIMTMTANDPKWSFVGRDALGRIVCVREKEPISDEATVGIYGFARGADFVDAAEEMIAANERVNGEFYVAPVYNRLIARGMTIRSFSVGAEGAGMYGLGIPADLEAFLRSPTCRRAVAKALSQE